MLITGVIIIISICAYFVPKNRYKFFVCTSICALSVLWLFFNPPEGFDLYRHYELLDGIRKISFSEMLKLKENPSITEMPGYMYPYLLDYLDSAPVYIVYLFIISRFAIRQLLPIMTCVVVYGLLFKRVIKLTNENSLSKSTLLLATFSILAFIDFRDISAIRNILAYTIFSFVAYEDLVNKKNKLICFCVYILLSFFHSSCIILLGIRILAFFSNKYAKIVFSILLLSMFYFGNNIIDSINIVANNDFLARLSYKIYIYRIARTSYNWHGAVVFIWLVLVSYLTMYIFKKSNIWNDKYKKYYVFVFYVFMFTLGSIFQYDILSRNAELLFILVLPFVMLIYESTLQVVTYNCRQSNLMSRNVAKNRYLVIYMTTMFLCFAFYAYIAYFPMNKYFFIG